MKMAIEDIKITTDDIKAHIRKVGETLIEDAEKFIIDPAGTTSIYIKTDINPYDHITTVKWEIERLADPRVVIKKKGEDNADSNFDTNDI